MSFVNHRPLMATLPAKLGAPSPAMRGAFVDLGKALRSGEVEAVIGHELAHVANGDMVMITLIQA